MNKLFIPLPNMTLDIEHDEDGVKTIHTLQIHPYGSNEVYWAQKLLAGVGSVTDEREKHQIFCDYAAALIAGWDDSSNEFFGAEYSPEHAHKICSLMLNRWLVTAIMEVMNDAVKPQASKSKP